MVEYIKTAGGYYYKILPNGSKVRIKKADYQTNGGSGSTSKKTYTNVVHSPNVITISTKNIGITSNFYPNYHGLSISSNCNHGDNIAIDILFMLYENNLSITLRVIIYKLVSGYRYPIHTDKLLLNVNHYMNILTPEDFNKITDILKKYAHGKTNKADVTLEFYKKKKCVIVIKQPNNRPISFELKWPNSDSSLSIKSNLPITTKIPNFHERSLASIGRSYQPSTTYDTESKFSPKEWGPL